MSRRKERRYRRHKRIRAKIVGTRELPRLCVFKSNSHIYAQLIDDKNGKTILSANDLGLKDKKNSTAVAEKPLKGKTAIAYEVGKLFAKKALENKIEKVVFDRGGYKYHGRVKALADGARDGGLTF